MANEKYVKASVLAFEKKLVPSDGYMYGTTWDKRHETEEPISLTEKSVRGTISNRLKASETKDPAKLDASIKVPNLQTVDSAALTLHQDTLNLHFTLKVLSGVQNPSACDSPSQHKAIQALGNEFIKTNGFQELAKRYALNLANGRFLWRNRVGAEKIEVTVTAKEQGKDWTFNAYDYLLDSFDTLDAKVKELASLIADALCGRKPYVLLDITASVLVGKGQEVYPSEELVLDKSNQGKKGKKSKVLYAVNGIAAMHSQKLGNAIRTIDTWYPGYGEEGTGRPIAIETYGSVTSLGKAYRQPKEKKDFYSLFDKWCQGAAPADKNDQNYVMAVLVRGGVFGEGKD